MQREDKLPENQSKEEEQTAREGGEITEGIEVIRSRERKQAG